MARPSCSPEMTLARQCGEVFQLAKQHGPIDIRDAEPAPQPGGPKGAQVENVGLS